MDRKLRRVSLVMSLVVLRILSPAARSAEETPGARPDPHPRLGMNLSGPADWNTEIPFVDVFRLSRPWVSQRKGAPWGQGPELDLDDRGWVKRLEPDCWAETPLCTIEGGHYPGGKYGVLWEGEGQLDVWNAASVVAREPGRLVVDVDPSRGGFHLKLLETDPENPVRNIRVILPGFEGTYRQHPFHPLFLERWRGMASLRFMDWMQTNGSEIRSWSERPRPEDATFSAKGVALETMIDLSNRLQSDPWFCMPHLADDGYVRAFAALVKERLDPKLRIYVEYSNEVWNGQFPQHRYAGEEGRKLGFAEKPWEAAWRYTARRSVEIFRIWEDVFGGHDRLLRVLATQAANPYVSERIVEFEEAYRHADLLAVAPYISMNVPPKGEGLTTEVVGGWTVEEALDHLETNALPEAIRWIRGQKEVADKYGLLLVAYEGGQHMVGVGGGENVEAVTALFHAANAHPRMDEIYARYFAAWTEAGGDIFCYFSSVSRWSKWGSWGILQHYDDDPEKSPKLVAAVRWARECGQPVAVMTKSQREAEKARQIVLLRREAERQLERFVESSKNPESADRAALERYVDAHGETTWIAPDNCLLCFRNHAEALTRLGLFLHVSARELEARATNAEGEAARKLEAKALEARQDMRVALETAEVERERYFDLCRTNGVPIDPFAYYGSIRNWEMLGDYRKALRSLDAYVEAVELNDEDKVSVQRLREAYQKEIRESGERE